MTSAAGRQTPPGKALPRSGFCLIFLLVFLASGPGLVSGAAAPPQPGKKPAPAPPAPIVWGQSPSPLDVIKNFHWLPGDTRICRGGQLKESDIPLLKAAGVTRVVNLREDDSPWEEQAVRAAGMEYVLIPMSSTRYPSRDEVRQIVAALGSRNNPDAKIYVHCAGGKHRTGAAVAVYRTLEFDWAFDRIKQEMDDCEFYTFGGHGCILDFVQHFRAEQNGWRLADWKPAAPVAVTPAAAGTVAAPAAEAAIAQQEPPPPPVATPPAETSSAPPATAASKPDDDHGRKETVGRFRLEGKCPALAAGNPTYRRNILVAVHVSLDKKGKVKASLDGKCPALLKQDALDRARALVKREMDDRQLLFPVHVEVMYACGSR